MKGIIRQLVVVKIGTGILVLSAWSYAQTVFSGRYEVSVSWGSSASLITSSYEVIPGQTIEVPLGDDFVSITVNHPGFSGGFLS